MSEFPMFVKSIAVSAALPVVPANLSLPDSDFVVLGTAGIPTRGAGLCLFECTAVSGFTGKVEVLTKQGGTWRTYESFQMAAGSAPARVAANTTITFASGDFIFVLTDGFYGVRILQDGGTSATFTCRQAEDAEAFVLTRILTDTTIVKVGSPADKISITPTMDTSAYGANQVWFVETAVAGAVRESGSTSILMDVTILDKDDQTAVDVYLFFFNATVTFGTVNENVSLSDADAAKCLGWVKINSSDWYDVGGSKIAHVRNVNLVLEAASGTSVYMAGVTTGTPTQTASGVIVTLGIMQN